MSNTAALEEYEKIRGYSYAMIGAKRVNPLQYECLYHGTDFETPESVEIYQGLPERGDNIDLLNHVEPPPLGCKEEGNNSAFRGTVLFPNFPACFELGASFWAGEGGWVYLIKNWIGYDTNQIFEGNVPDGRGGYRGALRPGECEIVTTARVPLQNISNVRN